MSRVAVITDTDSSLSPQVAADCGIRLVPITIHFGDEVYKTGVEIDDAALFARVDREGVLPTTSAPAPGMFAEAYQQAFDAGAESIVCVCVSSQVSATYAAALNARDLFPGREIRVIDSYTLSIAQGFMALAAADAARAGATAAEVEAAALAVRERTHLFAALATLKYLAMSGRVGHVAAGVAGLLNVKPILTIRDGKLELLERVRTQSKAWGRVAELLAQAVGSAPVERMAIFHVAAPEMARDFEQLLRTRMACPRDVLITELTPGLSVHSGAGMVGAAVLTAAA